VRHVFQLLKSGDCRDMAGKFGCSGTENSGAEPLAIAWPAGFDYKEHRMPVRAGWQE
tara:strand:+ start:1230 stop:1400 length:171 start_codon:yes stop_codon:yes gene_type:complete